MVQPPLYLDCLIPQDGHEEHTSSAPIQSFEHGHGFLHSAEGNLFGDDDEGGIVPVPHGILQETVDGHPSVLADLPALTRDPQHIAILQTNVELRLIVVDVFERVGDGVSHSERMGCGGIPLGQGEHVIDAAVGGGIASRSLSREGGGLQIVGDDLDGVGGVVDVGQGIIVGYVGGTDEGGETSSFETTRHSHYLDGALEHGGIFEVNLGQVGDASDGDLVLFHVHAEGETHEDAQLGTGVETAHVQSGIRLGVSQLRRASESIVVGPSLAVHARQHEVGASVDDAGDFGYGVPDKIAQKRSNDGDAAADGGFVTKFHRSVAAGIDLLQNGVDFGQVGGDESLVGGHHVLSGAEGRVHHIFCVGGAAHHLHDRVDAVVL
mmetsp:Transcript_33831/g.78121  ORF Transcript_33831/g.78121 Transcript_33831/m.78121 type:complete len:379 (-) Transcript_33831:419-1555(-)